LCHRYETSPPVAHVDCYRVDEGDELADLALDEVLDDGYVAIVEWGERLRARFATESLRCTLSAPVGDDPDRRRIAFDVTGASWTDRAATLSERLARALFGAADAQT
jgi:tRNA threonylcarbamoyladenosine biosynthesis protein TsaE